MRALLLACTAVALGASVRSPRLGRYSSASLSSLDSPVVAAARLALDRAEARVGGADVTAAAQRFVSAAEVAAAHTVEYASAHTAAVAAVPRPGRPTGYPDNAAGTALFQIDLCFLAYQTWAQSLVQPMNAFLNAKDSSLADPDSLKDAVRRFARLTVNDPVARGSCFPHYTAPPNGYDAECTGENGLGKPTLLRGPWRLMPTDDTSFGEDAVQKESEPILYRYSELKPERSVIAASKPGAFRAYMTPAHITGTIGKTWVTMPLITNDYVDIKEHNVHTVEGPDKTDILVAFEGTTGFREGPEGEQRSLVGYVLGRKTSDATFEVHVAFRGTRSE